MEEFSCDVECPYCGYEQQETFAFNFMEADQGGCNSKIGKFWCLDTECGKDFWANAYVSFDVSINDTFKKKPKAK